MPNRYVRWLKEYPEKTLLFLESSLHLETGQDKLFAADDGVYFYLQCCSHEVNGAKELRRLEGKDFAGCINACSAEDGCVG